MNRSFILSLVLCIAALDGIEAFYTGAAPAKSFSSVGTKATSSTRKRAFANGSSPTVRSNSVLLQQSDMDGTERGVPILVAALLGCAWCFTIPTEFRRAHICGNPTCIQHRAACYDCRTLTEIKEGIQEYYSNGGGIVWDFSIEEK